MSEVQVHRSALESDRFPMVAIGSLVVERTDKIAPGTIPALSVGLKGVTPQLEGVAKSLNGTDRKLVCTGDLVINSRADRRGASGLANQDGGVSMVYSVMTPNTTVLNPKYGHHLFRSVAFQEEFFRWGTGIVADLWSTNFTRMARIRVPLPTPDTQQRIADYLDRETGEIDTMIAKMDELAGQLEKRRTDAITHALRSDQEVAIGVLAKVSLGNMLRSSPQSETDILRPYLRAAHVQPQGVLDLSVPAHKMWFSPGDAAKLDLRRGDAVVVEGGVGGYGRAAFVAEDIPGYAFQNSIIRLRGASESDGRYLAHALVAARNEGLIELACLNVAMPHFTAEKVSRFRVPFHVAAERKRIADHLDEVTSRIDTMLKKVAELKSLLIERRAALITDVVTGRKDVA